MTEKMITLWNPCKPNLEKLINYIYAVNDFKIYPSKGSSRIYEVFSYQSIQISVFISEHFESTKYDRGDVQSYDSSRYHHGTRICLPGTYGLNMLRMPPFYSIGYFFCDKS